MVWASLLDPRRHTEQEWQWRHCKIDSHHREWCQIRRNAESQAAPCHSVNQEQNDKRDSSQVDFVHKDFEKAANLHVKKDLQHGNQMLCSLKSESGEVKTDEASDPSTAH